VLRRAVLARVEDDRPERPVERPLPVAPDDPPERERDREREP
jgi:hypothetical protein